MLLEKSVRGFIINEMININKNNILIIIISNQETKPIKLFIIIINRHLERTVGSSVRFVFPRQTRLTPVISLSGDGIITRRILIPWIYSHDLRFEIIDRRKPR